MYGMSDVVVVPNTSAARYGRLGIPSVEGSREFNVDVPASCDLVEEVRVTKSVVNVYIFAVTSVKQLLGTSS